MGLHIVALAKLKLLSNSRTLSPLAAGLLCTFVVKLGCSFRLLTRAHTDLLYASRLFLFQLGRIVFDGQEPDPGTGTGATTRWQRAIRLVWQRVVHPTRSPTQQQSDEESLHTLSMLAL